MRRVVDDRMYGVISDQINKLIWSLDPKPLSAYSWGMDRVDVGKVRDAIAARIPNIKFGKNEHANGIVNNNAYEIIYTGNQREEQICGLLHLTDDMCGGVICWVSDVDGTTKTPSRKLRV